MTLNQGRGSGSAWIRIHFSSWIRIQEGKVELQLFKIQTLTTFVAKNCLPKHNCSGLVLSTFDVFRPTNLLVFEKYLHTSKNNWGSSLMNYLDPVGPDHCPCGAAAYHRCLLCWARASERIGRAGAHLPGPAAARQPAAARHHGPGSHSRGGERQVLGQLDERPPGNWPAAPLSGPAAQLAASCRHSCQPHSQNKVSR